MKNKKIILLSVAALIFIFFVFVYCPKKVHIKDENVSSIVYENSREGYYGNVDSSYYSELFESINSSWAFTRLTRQKSLISDTLTITYEDGLVKTVNSIGYISGIPFYVYKETFDFSQVEDMLLESSIVYIPSVDLD